MKGFKKRRKRSRFPERAWSPSEGYFDRIVGIHVKGETGERSLREFGDIPATHTMWTPEGRAMFFRCSKEEASRIGEDSGGREIAPGVVVLTKDEVMSFYALANANQRRGVEEIE